MESTLTTRRLNFTAFSHRTRKDPKADNQQSAEIELPPMAQRILNDLLADPNSIRAHFNEYQYLRIRFRPTNPEFVKALDSFVSPDRAESEEATTRANNLTAALGYQQRDYDAESIMALTGVNVTSVDGTGTPLSPQYVQAARREADRLEAEFLQALQQSRQTMIAMAKALVPAIVADQEQSADQD